MAEIAPAPLSGWTNFFATTGTSAAALIGLMFVVISLVTAPQRSRPTSGGISVFSTPTVVHFGTALLISAVSLCPWHDLIHAAIPMGIVGLYGVAYVLHLMYRQSKLQSYRPDLEDWCWHAVLPFIAYGGILACAIRLPADPVVALFGLAGGVVLLLFIGIHNAWDIVTYIVVGSAKDDDAPIEDVPTAQRQTADGDTTAAASPDATIVQTGSAAAHVIGAHESAKTPSPEG
jgi:hypothetical protein